MQYRPVPGVQDYLVMVQSLHLILSCINPLHQRLIRRCTAYNCLLYKLIHRYIELHQLGSRFPADGSGLLGTHSEYGTHSD